MAGGERLAWARRGGARGEGTRRREQLDAAGHRRSRRGGGDRRATAEAAAAGQGDFARVVFFFSFVLNFFFSEMKTSVSKSPRSATMWRVIYSVL